MNTWKKSFDRMIQVMVWLVLVYAVAEWLYTFSTSISLLTPLRDVSYLRTNAKPSPDSTTWIINHVREKEFKEGYLPQIGDTLVAVNNSEVNEEIVQTVFKAAHTADDTVSITTLRDGQLRDTTLQFRNIPVDKVIFIFVLLACLPIPFFVVAFWALFKQGSNTGVRVLTLMILSIAVVIGVVLESSTIGMKCGLMGIPPNEAPGFQFTAYNTPALMLSALGTGFWLHLAFLFPSPSAFYKKRKWLVLLLAYGVFVPTLIQGAFFTSLMVAKYSATTIIISMGIGLLQLIAGFVVMINNVSTRKDPMEKRQVRVLLQSVGLGMVLMTVFGTILGFSALGEDPSKAMILISFLLMLASMMLIPLGFAYAFTKYRLLEVEGRIKRGIIFLMTSGGLLFAVFILLFIVGTSLVNAIGIESKSSIMLLASFIAVLYIPLHNIIQKRLEKRIFRTRWKLRQMLESFVATAARYHNRKELWEAYGDQLRANIGVKGMYVLLFDQDQRQLHPSEGEIRALPEGSTTQRELIKRPRPLAFEEIRAIEKQGISTEEQQWFEENEVSILIPIKLHGDLVGALALGFEYGYDEIKADELDILTSITERIALENENLQLIEDNLEKRRLEEQLAMARTVQRRFLPSELGETPGLSLAAECKFSLEVAGDTYDVVPLSDSRTLFAIGDVSGKGAGAAMIMANLQASLRALSEADLPIETTVTRLNNLVARATSSEQFVTYFAAIYTPDTKQLHYVNAGHNPPILIHANGDVELLETGGPLLGVVPQFPYAVGELQMTEGDLLTTFTDGVTEAENATGEMYGEDTLADFLVERRNESPETLITLIKEDVDRFRGDTPLGDDLTMLVVKVNN